MFGIPSSLSDSYYLLESKKRNLGALFTIMMFSMTFLIIAPMLQITPENWQFLAFLSVIGIGFVGAAPLFKSGGTESKVHTYAAAASAIFSLLWMFICYPELVGSLFNSIIIVMIGIFISKRNVSYNYIFWIEMILFLSIYFSLIELYS